MGIERKVDEKSVIFFKEMARGLREEIAVPEEDFLNLIRELEKDGRADYSTEGESVSLKQVKAGEVQVRLSSRRQGPQVYEMNGIGYYDAYDQPQPNTVHTILSTLPPFCVQYNDMISVRKDILGD